jgi:coiled-coil domain-containing protein 55
MNISLSVAAKKKTGGDRSTSGTTYGLNVRGKTSTNVFGDDDDSEDEGSASSPPSAPPGDARAVVNQALRKEQEALRQRAQKELAQQASQQQQDIYDYDGAYESFQSTASASQKKDDNDDRKSRYIGNLLKTAQERKLDRDIAYERKVAREQKQEEDENVELRGKERFVTASYKRKLEERKLWKEEQDKIAKLEEDVTQKEGGMANFYGNLNQNVAMGGEAPGGEVPRQAEQESQQINVEAKETGLSFLEEFAKTEEEDIASEVNETQRAPGTATLSEKPIIDPEVQRQERRRRREEKVAQARVRYLERHGIEANQE